MISFLYNLAIGENLTLCHPFRMRRGIYLSNVSVQWISNRPTRVHMSCLPISPTRPWSPSSTLQCDRWESPTSSPCRCAAPDCRPAAQWTSWVAALWVVERGLHGGSERRRGYIMSETVFESNFLVCPLIGIFLDIHYSTYSTAQTRHTRHSWMRRGCSEPSLVTVELIKLRWHPAESKSVAVTWRAFMARSLHLHHVTHWKRQMEEMAGCLCVCLLDHDLPKYTRINPC